MKLTIDGYLRRASTLKIFCGLHDEEKKIEPDFMVEAEEEEMTYINVTGTYSTHKGFEFVK